MTSRKFWKAVTWSMLFRTYVLPRTRKTDYRSLMLMEGELKQIINALIGEDAVWQEYLQDKTAKPDAVWGQIMRAILELKNVDGVGGNPILQATLDYAKILFQAQAQAEVQPQLRGFVELAYHPHRHSGQSAAVG
ncbi:hypothetical protein ACEPAH_9203 [Sanghuangporus vaninii]